MQHVRGVGGGPAELSLDFQGNDVAAGEALPVVDEGVTGDRPVTCHALQASAAFVAGLHAMPWRLEFRHAPAEHRPGCRAHAARKW